MTTEQSINEVVCFPSLQIGLVLLFRHILYAVFTCVSACECGWSTWVACMDRHVRVWVNAVDSEIRQLRECVVHH